MNLTVASWLEISLVGHCRIKNVLRVIQTQNTSSFENKLAAVHCATRSPSIKPKKGELTSVNILRTTESAT